MAIALRVLLTSLAVALFLPTLWTLASAWIFYADHREASAFSTVGMIEFDLPEGRSSGTAFLVDECAVLTNFHVAFGPWYVTALRPSSDKNRGTFILTGVTLANGSHPSTGAVPVIWGDYTGPDRQFRKPANDWVVLALDECLGYRHGYLIPNDTAFDDAVPESGGFATVGYSAGRQMIESNCSIQMAGDSEFGAVMLDDCATLPGDSGAPIIRRGTNKVVAIASGFHAGFSPAGCSSGRGVVRSQWNPQCTNSAVPLSAAVIDRIGAATRAIQVQYILTQLGYETGPYGLIDQPELAAAVKQAQMDIGLAANGEPSCALIAILKMRVIGI
jgi:putative peptidoglycan binding protein